MPSQRSILAALVLAIPAAAFAADPVYAPAEIKKAFMDGDITTLEKGLASLKDAAVPAADRADIAYIRKCVSENRPAWFTQAKANRTFNINVTVFGRNQSFAFDPSIPKGSIRYGWTNNKFNGATYWTQDDIDSSVEAEHGYTKGELQDLGIWLNFGMLDGYTLLPVNDLAALGKDTNQKLLQTFMQFRTDVAGFYYSLPRARKWDLFLCARCYMAGIADTPGANGRQAVAAAVIVEILSRPDKYPSFKFPRDIDTEESAALWLKDFVEKKPWTLAEDQLLREAIRIIAAANEYNAIKAGKFAYPNQTFMAIDKAADKPFREKRDAWVKAAVSKLK
jgi:hypothetical protein